jgi:predicted small lipoprotein YifL
MHGARDVIFAANRLFARLFLCVVLAGSVGLAGCGRKGPLEAPPSASIAPPALGPDGQPVAATPADSFDEQGRPVAPRGKQQRFFLDWLLD